MNTKRSVAFLKVLMRDVISLFANPTYLLRKNNVIPWDFDFRKIEVELTSYCSMACFNCNRSIRQAPCKEYITCEQIEKFISESIARNWKWKTIGITGGEPTLHPYFFEILDLFKRYKAFYPHCHFLLFTNGCGKRTREVLSKLPVWVKVINSEKKSNANVFCSYNVAPVDVDDFHGKDFSQGCRIVHCCGMGLTRYGFYPCGPGASLDRVFGFDIGIKTLNLLDEHQLRTQLSVLCRYCGHFKENYHCQSITEEHMSESWEQAYKEYETKKPLLYLY